MTVQERISHLRDWQHDNLADIEAGITAGNLNVMRFVHALAEAVFRPSPETAEAAEIAHIELNADWDRK